MNQKSTLVQVAIVCGYYACPPHLVGSNAMDTDEDSFLLRFTLSTCNHDRIVSMYSSGGEMGGSRSAWSASTWAFGGDFSEGQGVGKIDVFYRKVGIAARKYGNRGFFRY